MSIFRVNVPRTGFSCYEVEAVDAKHAKDMVYAGCGLCRGCDDCEDDDINNWDVQLIQRGHTFL